MPVSPCRNQVICPDCFDPPVLNLSGEAEDRNQYLGINVIFPWEPPIGWWSKGCKTWVYSEISQWDADQRARDQEVHCFVCDDPCNPPSPPCLDNPDCPPPPPGTDPDSPPPPPPTGGGSFSSNAQTCFSECPNGDIVSLTKPAGTVTSPMSQADADARALALCLQDVERNKFCWGFSMIPACLDTFYEHIFSVTGGTPPYNIQIDATSLPVGFSLTGDGYFSGTGSTPGTYTLILSATDSASPPRVIYKNFTFHILQITTSDSMPNGDVGVAYSEALASNPSGVGSWTVVSGVLPDGLTLNALTGVVSGTPSKNGKFDFTVAIESP